MIKAKKISIAKAKWAPDEANDQVTAFLERPAVDPKAEQSARGILKDIREEGDAAVLKYAEQFDKSKLKAEQLKVTARDRIAAREQVDNDFKTAAREARDRINRFARAGLRDDWDMSSPKGGSLGERYVPYERVGAYVPGGAAPLASTALMTITLAKAAGVSEVIACTPAEADGSVNPYLVFAMDIAGATDIYRVGGIQAIGAMAYGTATIPKVQKIVGPGGPYVTAAKKLVYGDVSLDMVAGPSEIAVLADDSASAVHVAADLLSQAEHGTGAEKALLVTPSDKLAIEVERELIRQAGELSRTEAITEVLNSGTMLVVVDHLDSGMELCNRFAPEHFELMVREPRRWVQKVRCAGAVFAGPWAPECSGDFAAGPSHVLPTGGTAALFSGLTVDDFRRRISVMALTKADLQDMLPIIEAFGRVEGLDGHTRSAQVRFE
jgi:histidinol dehydrogenase